MELEYFFDFTCPYAYLGSTRIEAIAERTGARLSWRPMLLGGVFRAVNAGETELKLPPAKKRYNAIDIGRWAALWRVPLVRPDDHSRRTVRALRALLALEEEAWPPVIHAIYRAMWRRGEDVSDPAVLARALEEAGVPGDARERALAANEEPSIKDELRRRTDEAIERGVFGAPTTFVSGGGEPLMFFGQDRLQMVEAAARGWRPDRPAPARDETPAATGETAALDFFYDFSSPFSYLASTQVEEIAARSGARLRWRPFLLGALFKQLDTADVPINAMSDAKRRWFTRDMEYWAAWRGVPFRFNSHFPLRTVTPLRIALLAGDRIAEVSHALFRAAWAEDRDLGDPQVLGRLLDELGLDPDALLAQTKEQATKDRLKANTDEALESGVFGAPSFVLRREGRDPELFFGQDRLDLIERTLRG